MIVDLYMIVDYSNLAKYTSTLPPFIAKQLFSEPKMLYIMSKQFKVMVIFHFDWSKL